MPQSQPQKLKPVSSSLAAEPAGNLELFKSKVQGYIRLSRNSQKELAEALGLHPKVLGRKLSSNSVALLLIFLWKLKVE